MRSILAGVTALSVAGCSFIFVDGPKSSTPPQVYPSCDEGQAMPYIDAAIAAIYLIASAAALSDGGDTDSTAEVVPGSIAAAAVFGASAWVGFSRTGACRERREAYRAQFGDPRMQQPMIYAYPSAEGQACYPQIGCQPGLVCASGLCVRPPMYQPPVGPSPAPIQPGPGTPAPYPPPPPPGPQPPGQP